MASKIATMSPIAVTGTKHNLNYSRDHSVEEGLKYMVRVKGGRNV
jgi:delta(3,5)-delta(2,4)-dienoyl-CoA isomerase